MEEGQRQEERRSGGWSNRSSVEIMVLIFAITASVSIILTGISVTIIEVVHPLTDTTAITSSLMSIITGVVGALLGLIAGKADKK